MMMSAIIPFIMGDQFFIPLMGQKEDGNMNDVWLNIHCKFMGHIIRSMFTEIKEVKQAGGMTFKSLKNLDLLVKSSLLRKMMVEHETERDLLSQAKPPNTTST